MSHILRHIVCCLILLSAFSLKAHAESSEEKEKKAVFAGGCFWCMEPPYEKLKGVKSVVSGYSGGTLKNPTYEKVGSGGTGHIEVVEVTYDPSVVTYEKLLDVYWRQIDPTDSGGAFCDRGETYTSAIFYGDENEKKLAEVSKDKLQKSKFKGQTIATKIRKLEKFYKAEEYHQDYYKKNPVRYKIYRFNCGRDQRLKEVWNIQ